MQCPGQCQIYWPINSEEEKYAEFRDPTGYPTPITDAYRSRYTEHVQVFQDEDETKENDNNTGDIVNPEIEDEDETKDNNNNAGTDTIDAEIEDEDEDETKENNNRPYNNNNNNAGTDTIDVENEDQEDDTLDIE